MACTQPIPYQAIKCGSQRDRKWGIQDYCVVGKPVWLPTNNIKRKIFWETNLKSYGSDAPIETTIECITEHHNLYRLLTLKTYDDTNVDVHLATLDMHTGRTTARHIV
jgi:hypothetical protein